MTKVEFIKEMKTIMGVSEADARKAYEAFEKVTVDTLTKGENISLTGFMSYKVVDRAERECFKNPRDKAQGKMTVPAHKAIKIECGKSLKDIEL